MALPDQVKKQIKAGEEAYEAAQAASKQPVEEPHPEVENTPEPEAPAQVEEAAPVEEAVEAAPAEIPAEDAAPGNEPDEGAPAGVQEKPIDWEHRFKVLQGKYNNEIPRLAAEVKTLKDRNDNLELQVLEGAKPASDQPATNGTGSPSPLSAGEVEDYGEDLVEVINKVARHAVHEELRPIRSSLDTVSSTVKTAETRRAEDDKQRYERGRREALEYLTSKVPGWAEQNEDPEFINWLAQRDAFSGVERQALLNDALAANDGPRITKFFTSFNDEHATVAPVRDDQTSEKRQGAVKLEDLAAPKGQGAGGAQRQKRMWKRADIRRFYDDCAAGEYRNREDDRLRTERDIFAAQLEGRIIDLPPPSQ